MPLQAQRIADPEPFIHFNSVFSHDECESIIAIAKAIGTARALTGGAGPAGNDNPERRRSRVVWLHRQETVEWVYGKLEDCAIQTATQWFPCDVSGVHEAIQITHYDAVELGHYDWHMDIGPGDMRTRKMSMVALLSPCEAFQGGGLTVQWAPSPVDAKMARGDVVTFPGYSLHRVAPVTQGERWSLVWWMHGPVWR